MRFLTSYNRRDYNLNGLEGVRALVTSLTEHGFFPLDGKSDQADGWCRGDGGWFV